MLYHIQYIILYILYQIFLGVTYFCGFSSFNLYDLHRKLETHSRSYNGGENVGEGRETDDEG